MPASPPPPPAHGPTTRGATEASSRRTGRPPRISRDQIVDAAVEIGLRDLTLKAVADRLDVSVAALYHHVSGKDDLLRLAADSSAGRLRLPEDVGQHWAVWLLEWAVYTREAFVADPALLDHFIDADISAEVMAPRIEVILAALSRQGFSATEARAAYELVSAQAIGSAVAAIRDDRAWRRGDPPPRVALGSLAHRSPAELPVIRALTETDPVPEPTVAFAEQLRPVLLGIAVHRGDDPQSVAEVLAEKPTDRDH
ncbi:TetR/AcrR family transcriptional regulator [Rhabdothermincola salaria]|uniref:TetR/AcrR family transcriptional regulator n=1 Tax=Rhabdothermincola salaria TaxID=2903142 RepID=UPI001E335648|nr:TetR/AcrR family transcriptional regulator [Rhabdothermincola salaria]MCD9624332.1 TetR/AcrR family transcriptional regulator [Rhabdothermincola salaria]